MPADFACSGTIGIPCYNGSQAPSAVGLWIFIYFFLSGLSRWNFFFVFFQLLEIINCFSTLTGRFSELLYTYV